MSQISISFKKYIFLKFTNILLATQMCGCGNQGVHWIWEDLFQSKRMCDISQCGREWATFTHMYVCEICGSRGGFPMWEGKVSEQRNVEGLVPVSFPKCGRTQRQSKWIWEGSQCGRELCCFWMWEGIVSKQGSYRMWEGAMSEQPNQETEESWPLK